MLQEVNNLKVRVDSDPERPLDEGERERALKRLRSGKSIKLRKKDNENAKPTRDLGLPAETVFNLASGGRKEIKGDETTAKLTKKNAKNNRAQETFGQRWFDFSFDKRNEIAKFLIDVEDPECVRQKAKDEWGLNDAQAKAVSEISLPSGYGNLSKKAIEKLLPHLKRGCVFSDAVVAAGYPHHSDFRNTEAHEQLPYYGEVLERDVVGADRTKDPEKDGEQACYGRIPNPTVHIGLGQLRRVVNRLIEVYGKPKEIVVELARDLKSNREQRLDYEARQRKGADDNKRFTKMLESMEIRPTADTLRKLRLWEEQGPPQARLCPYTGKTLSCEMVVSNQTEIDHILPRRTLDDSMNNKVICVAYANRVKGDRSPYEAFGHNPGDYDYEAIRARAAKLPRGKSWRFEKDAMERFEDESEFLDRQLNETRYLSRTARTYLAHLYDEKTEGRQRVRVIPGRMTSLLRYGWGIEGMLSKSENGETQRKTRNDHRHHAIDAFVVANTTQGLLQQFAKAVGSGHYDAEERLAKLAPPPWDGFNRSQLKLYLDRMVVSYKPDHGTRGKKGKTTRQLHEETAYGLIQPIKPMEDGSYKVVVRKSLGRLKKKDLKSESIQDPVLRKALLRLWEEVESQEGEANPAEFAKRVKAKFAERAKTDGVLIGKKRQKVRSVRLLDKQRVIPIKRAIGGEPYKGYLPGGNEFAEVWRMPADGKWEMVLATTFEANQPGFDAAKLRPDPYAKRLMRLQINDMGALGEGPERRIVRVRKMWTSRRDGSLVVMDDHNEANVDQRIRKKEPGMREEKYSAKKLQELGFRKVGVDEIGRVRDPGPQKTGA